MDGLPVELGGGTGLTIQVSQQYRVIENPDPRKPWQVKTVSYHYTLGEIGGREILSYQWHPNVPETSPWQRYIYLYYRWRKSLSSKLGRKVWTQIGTEDVSMPASVRT